MKVLCFAFIACAFAVSRDRQLDVPRLGSLLGAEGSHATFFGGIPYAKPPVGPLRWQPPVPHGPWQSPRRAGWLNLGHQCVQPGNLGKEDCLYLNVNTPTAAITNKSLLPAMVWIHGGSYVTGSGNDYVKLGDEMVTGVTDKVVVVTINYRLNVFGFLASSDVKGRTTDQSAGNFGIQDQRLAMKWVQDHIAVFGGNGQAVTIFGESAGGNSVWNHLAQPASFSLYKHAIIESGTYDMGARPFDTATTAYQGILTATNCSNLDCLLNISSSALEQAAGHGWGPVIDGISLAASPADLIDAGKHNKNAPVIIGSNRDEDASPWFIGGELPANLTEAGFDQFYLAEKLRANLKQAKAIYDPSKYVYPTNRGNYSQWWWTATRMATDQVPGLGACGVRWLARKLVGSGSQVNAYLFGRPCQSLIGAIIPGCKLGSVISPHAGEIPYVFDDALLTRPQEDRELGNIVSGYWAAFAHSGSVTDWPQYDRDSDSVKRFDVSSSGGVVIQQHLRQEACDFWEANMEDRQDGVVYM